MGIRFSFVITVSALVLVAACSDGGSTGDGGALTEKEQRELRNSLTALEENVGFAPLYPQYVPNQLAGLPATDYKIDGSLRTAFLLFSPRSNYTAVPQPGPLKALVVREEYQQQLEACADRNVLSKIPGYKCEDLRMDSRPAVAETVPGGVAEVSYSLQFQSRSIRLTLDFTWALPPSALREPSVEMKAESQRVAMSMLDGE